MKMWNIILKRVKICKIIKEGGNSSIGVPNAIRMVIAGTVATKITIRENL